MPPRNPDPPPRRPASGDGSTVAGNRRAESPRHVEERPDRTESLDETMARRGTRRGPRTLPPGGSDDGVTLPSTPVPRAARAALTTAATGYRRFEVGAELGKGGMGRIVSAHDPVLRRSIAIKQLRKDGPAAIEAFVEEAQITGQLEHPNIVPVHEMGLDDAGRPFLAMKRVHGADLAQLIRTDDARQPITPTRMDWILRVFDKVCDAMSYAHNRGVIHRDLKPHNVMVGDHGEVLVMDWGLAKPVAVGADGSSDGLPPTLPAPRQGQPNVVSDRRESSDDLTVAGDIIGTPAYMPPEQANGKFDRLDVRSDIFSLGATLYAMLAVRPPYEGRTSLDVLANAAKRNCVPPSKASPARRIPRELDAIVMKAMAVRPADRYPTIAGLQADLSAWRNNERGSAWRDGIWSRAVKWTRRHPAATLAVSLSLVFGLALGGVLLMMQLQASHHAMQLQQAEADKQLADERALLANERAARAEQDRRIQLAIQEQRYDDLREMSGLDAVESRDVILEEFSARFHEANDDIGFVRRLPRSEQLRFLEAFDRVIRLAERPDGDASSVTAQDYLVRGLLRLLTDQMIKGAEEDFTKVIQREPREALGYANRAAARAKLGDHEGAIADATEALALEPDDGAALNNRGHAYAMTNRLDLAIADFRRATELAPDDIAALRNLVRAMKDSGRGVEALPLFDRLLEASPGDQEMRYHRALFRINAEQWQGAIDDCSEIIRRDPRHGAAYVTRGEILLKAGRYADAIREFDTGLGYLPDYARAYSSRGVAKVRNGDLPGARADFVQATRLEPRNANFHANLAVAHDSLGDRPAAIEAMRNAWRHATGEMREHYAGRLREWGASVPE